MNRSLANVILGGYSTTVTAQVKGEALQHQEVDVAGAVDALTNARSIIIVRHRIIEVLDVSQVCQPKTCSQTHAAWLA